MTMTSQEYREQAEALLTPRPGEFTVRAVNVEQAAVWACLAEAAATTEATAEKAAV